MADKSKHVLGLSGGKDSSALAIYMSQAHPELEIEYFFTDTGEELEEVYEYLAMLEGFLGKKIRYLDPGRDFKFYLAQYNQFLPSAQTRWCTKDLKIKPFEKWVKSEFTEQGYTVYSYVAIRADEDFRQGLNSKNSSLITKLPFKDDGIDKAGVFEILENSGLGLPKYYDWRSRSGCTFCFLRESGTRRAGIQGATWRGPITRTIDDDVSYVSAPFRPETRFFHEGETRRRYCVKLSC